MDVLFLFSVFSVVFPYVRFLPDKYGCSLADSFLSISETFDIPQPFWLKDHEAFAMSGATTPRDAADGASAEDPGGSLPSLADALECAVCTALMVDPVVTADGHSYCRACILEWFPSC